MTTKRKYALKARAERQAETRRRITQATVELHEKVGPARTQISAIAERAGVPRMTVYRHFPDERALFEACGAHWHAAHPLPDQATWASESDPGRRVRLALNALYEFYAENQRMLGHVLRDAEGLPALHAVIDAELGSYLAWLREALLDTCLASGRSRREIEALLALATSFSAWRKLTGDGSLETSQAADLMARLLTRAA